MIGLLCTRKLWCRPCCALLIALTGGAVYCHLLIASGGPSDGGIATMTVLCVRGKSISIDPQCNCWMSRSAPLGGEMCTLCSVWRIVRNLAGALWDQWDGSIAVTVLTDLSKLLCAIYDIDICTMIWFLFVFVFMLYLCHATVLWNAYLFGPKWSINYYY